MARSQLSRLLSGERGMSTDTIERLADYLGYRIVIERDTNIKANRNIDTKKHSAGKARKGA